MIYGRDNGGPAGLQPKVRRVDWVEVPDGLPGELVLELLEEYELAERRRPVVFAVGSLEWRRGHRPITLAEWWATRRAELELVGPVEPRVAELAAFLGLEVAP